jgi:hypothetical protein
MPNYRSLARQVAQQVGVPAKVFLSLVHSESGFNPGARSPVGAEGLTQLMPGTANALASRYGIDTSTPYGNLLGGAHYLKEQIERFGDLRKAVAAYNAGPGAVAKYGGVPPYVETQRYVRKVLGGASGEGAMTAVPSLAAASARGAAPPARSELASALIENLGEIGARGGYVDPNAMLRRTLVGIALDRVAPPAATPGNVFPSFSPTRLGRVTIRPGADRPGVSLQPDILSFARRVASVWGGPLMIGTGTNHNRFVAGTRRQSAHWTGHAADIPASGAALTRLGQAALVAAGADPAWARRQKGGLFNVGPYQVIFNSMTGGNHYNHLHIGMHGLAA